MTEQPDIKKQRRAARKTAALLFLLSFVILVGFIWSVVNQNGNA